MLDTARLLDQARETLEDSIKRNKEQHTTETGIMLRIDRSLHVEAVLEFLFATLEPEERTCQLWEDYTNALATIKADRLQLWQQWEKLGEPAADIRPALSLLRNDLINVFSSVATTDKDVIASEMLKWKVTLDGILEGLQNG